MNSFYNRNSRNRSRNTKSYSKSNVNGYVNPIGTNVPIIAQISTDKSKDNKNKSTRANNAVNNTNPMNVGVKFEKNNAAEPTKTSWNVDERIHELYSNKPTKKQKNTELARVDISKGSQGGMNSRLYKPNGDKGKVYYKDDRGELHEIIDYNPNSNIQQIRKKRRDVKNNADVVKQDDIVSKNLFNTERISPYAKQKLKNQGFTSEEAEEKLRNERIRLNKEKAEKYQQEAEEAYLKQQEADTILEKGASLADNFFRGALSGVQGLVTGAHQIGDAITSPFRTQEEQDEARAQLEMLKALQGKTSVGNYMQDDGLFGVAQQMSSGIGNMAPSMLLGGLGGAAVGSGAMGLNAFGSGINQALDDTDDLTKARMYGLASAGTEMLTEKMFGAIPGLGKGYLDKPLTGALKGVGNSALRKAGRVASDFAGEAVEEYASTVIDEFLKDIYQGSSGKGTFEERLAGVQPEAIKSGLIGGLTGNLLNMPSYMTNSRFNADNPPIQYYMTEEGRNNAVQGFQDYLNQTPNIEQFTNEFNNRQFNYGTSDYEQLANLRNELSRKALLASSLRGQTLDDGGLNIDLYYVPNLMQALNSRERSAIKRNLKKTGRIAAENYFNSLPPEQLSLDLDFNNYDPLTLTSVTPDGVLDYLQFDLFNDLKKKDNNAIENNEAEAIDSPVDSSVESQQDIDYDEQQMTNFVESNSDVVDNEVADSEGIDYWNLSEEERAIVDDEAELLFADEEVDEDIFDEEENGSIDNSQFFDKMPQNPKISIDDEGVAKLNQKAEDYTGVKESDPVRQEHIDKYGAIRPESKYKVEKSTDGRNRVHQTIDTLVNSKIFKGHSDIIKSVRDDVTHKDKGTYTPKTVSQAMETARNFIDGYGSMGNAIESITANDRTFTDKIEESNLKADDKLNIYGTLLEDLVAMKNATQDDKELQSYLNDKITDCIPLFNEIANQSGRALRYIQAIKNTVPEYSYAKAQVKMIQRFINRQNSILKGKGKEFILPTEIQEMIDNPNRIHYTDEQWQNIFKLVGNEAAKQAPKSLFDRLRTIRYLAMLMNPRTWVRNVAGNGVNYGFNGVSDVVRWAIENGVSKFDKDNKYFYTVNKGNAFHVDKALSDLIKANITKLNPNYGVKVEENNIEFYKNKNFASKGIGKALDVAQRINEYALDKPDVFFSQKKYVSSLAQVLERNGIDADLLGYMIANPLDAGDIDLNGTTYTLGELNGKRAILDKALNFAERRAQEITYRQDNSIDTWLKSATRGDKLGPRAVANIINVVTPFTKTPFNIATEMVKDSPLGIAQGLSQLHTALKTGGDINTAIETMSKGLTGTGVMLLGMFLHNQGFLTGDGNDMDDKEKEFAMQRGWKPFSFRYDGNDSTVFADISALTPMSMSLALGAVIDEMTCNYKTFSEIGPNGEANDRVDYIQTLKDFAIAMAEPWANMSALSGISNTLPQYTDSEGDWLVEMIYNTGKNYVSQFIPQVLKQINRTFNDPKVHTTQGMGNSTDKFISGLSKDSLLTSKNNNVAIDYRGNQKEYFDGFFGLDGVAGRAMNNFINPFTMSEMKHDPVADELARLYRDTGESGVIPSNSYVKQYTDKGTKYEVTRDDWQDINEDKRKTYMNYVDEFVNSKEYQNMDDKERVEVIDRLKKLTTESNKSKLLDSKGVDYDSSSLAKVAAGEKQGLKAYQTVLLNPDKEAIISTESTADLLVNLSDNGFTEEQAREYLANVGDEISDNDEKIIKGMFQQSDTYNQIMDEFTRDIPNDLDDYEYDKMYKKAGKQLATCLGEYQQLMEGADIKATDYQRLVRAMDNGVSPYEYLTIASHNSMKEEILYMRDTLGRSVDEIMWFEQNIMKRAKNKLNEAWEVLND